MVRLPQKSKKESADFEKLADEIAIKMSDLINRNGDKVNAEQNATERKWLEEYHVKNQKKDLDSLHGYILETEYVKRFFHNLNPLIMNYNVLLKGLSPIDTDKPFTYFELGCGQGMSSNLLAVANPNGEFFANDHNSQHIDYANSIAKIAGTGNVTFYEKNFKDMLKEKLPEFDFITLHGIYSWVGDENRQYIKDFIKKNLKQGGLVYNSYNCAAGHASFIPIRRLLLALSYRVTGSLEERMNLCLGFLKKINFEESTFFKQNPKALDFLKKSFDENKKYLVHELFYDDWTLFHGVDVAKEMAEIGIRYIARGTPQDNFAQFLLTGDNLKLYESIKDPEIADMTLELLTATQFRVDLFHKNRKILTREESASALGNMRVCLNIPRQNCKLEVKINSVNISLNEEEYAPILDLLAETGPKTINQLHDLLKDNAQYGDLEFSTFTQYCVILIALYQLAPALSEQDDDKRIKAMARLHDWILNSDILQEDINYIISPLTGSTIFLKKIDLMFLRGVKSGRKNLSNFIIDLILEHGGSINDSEGNKLSTREELTPMMKERAEYFTEVLYPYLEHHKLV